jgi:hypothetical protein
MNHEASKKQPDGLVVFVLPTYFGDRTSSNGRSDLSCGRAVKERANVKRHMIKLHLMNAFFIENASIWDANGSIY